MNRAGFGGSGVLQLSTLMAKPGAKQLVRYAIAGICVTQFAAAVYSVLVLFWRLDPLLANVVSTGCGLSAGYLAHSRWSFAGGAAAPEHAKVGRFLLSSLVAFLINSTWVWLLVTTLHQPPLTPVPLMMLVTPWVSFLLNRHWVFRAA
ncbi:MAG: GtrA family protein [Sphingomicrobium sp.]